MAAIVFGIYWNRGICRYKYAWTLSRTTAPSPYRYDTECPLVHAKLYVIDKKVAFLGSLNFTNEGLFDNFETCVRVDKSEDVRNLEILINSKLHKLGSWSFTSSGCGHMASRLPCCTKTTRGLTS